MLRRPSFVLALWVAAPAAAQPGAAATFTVGTASAARGTTAYGALVVPAGVDSGLRIPVAVIHGARPGRVVAFVAGSHGTEYASIVAMQRLIPRLDAARLAGTVIVVPLINIASIEGMVPHLNPVDRKSMNGNYPGDPQGTQTQRALDAVARSVVAPADVVIDLHGGDLDEDLRPYSYWYRGGRAAQDSAGRALALAFGLDHVIVTDADPSSPTAGRSLSGHALVAGKTVLVAEAGRSGTVLDTDVAALVDGSLRALALGRRTGDVRAPIDGLVTFVRGVPSMWPKATLVNVAPVLDAPAPWQKP